MVIMKMMITHQQAHMHCIHVCTSVHVQAHKKYTYPIYTCSYQCFLKLYTNEYVSHWHQNSSELGLNKMHLICNSTLTTEQFRTYNYLCLCTILAFAPLQGFFWVFSQSKKKESKSHYSCIYTLHLYNCTNENNMRTISAPIPTHPPPPPPMIYVHGYIFVLSTWQHWVTGEGGDDVVSALACACFQPQFELQHSVMLLSSFTTWGSVPGPLGSHIKWRSHVLQTS